MGRPLVLDAYGGLDSTGRSRLALARGEQLVKELAAGATPGAVVVGGLELVGRAEVLVRIVAGDPTPEDEAIVRAADVGWGAILAFGDQEKELKGGEAHTTNNRMELMAAISALEAMKKPVQADIHTDSQYVRNGITSWIHGWKRNGWKTADKKPVKNEDLWRRLDELAAKHDIEWHWVRGHAGHPENERADRLANRGIPAGDPRETDETNIPRHGDNGA